MARKKYGRYPRFPAIDISQYGWGEGYLIGKDGTATPLYEDIEEVWAMFQKWIEDIMLPKADDEECAETVVGRIVLIGVTERDAFLTKQAIKLHDDVFMKVFRVNEMPKEPKDLLDVLLHDEWEDAIGRNW